ncbi:uncharacterized protein IWZ02DRAFT_463324 [Phyllosticta citriasiana]|uniref:uncharacterized protein n=1 Tax=Phyllosticta citriasiana TaxID=595635 RepID=UPI0030FDDE6C
MVPLAIDSQVWHLPSLCCQGSSLSPSQSKNSQSTWTTECLPTDSHMWQSRASEYSKRWSFPVHRSLEEIMVTPRLSVALHPRRVHGVAPGDSLCCREHGNSGNSMSTTPRRNRRNWTGRACGKCHLWQKSCDNNPHRIEAVRSRPCETHRHCPLSEAIPTHSSGSEGASNTTAISNGSSALLYPRTTAIRALGTCRRPCLSTLRTLG